MSRYPLNPGKDMQASQVAPGPNWLLNHTGYTRLAKIARSLIVLLAVGYILELIALASIRMFYPYELEWSESAVFEEIRWIADGHPLYGPPQLAFLPLAYTPVYFYLSAAVTKIIGLGFLAPRLVSVLAALGCFALLFVLVYQKTRRNEASRLAASPLAAGPLATSPLAAGLLAAGLYAASFRFTGAWMDLAKTDSLFLLIVLLAFWVGIRCPRRAGYLLSGSLFALAYFTKQIALPLVLALAPIALISSRGRSWLQWCSAFALGLGIFWLWDASSKGWYSFYTIETLLYHERVLNLTMFWASLLGKMWPAFLLASLYAALEYKSARQRPGGWQGFPWQYLGFGSALILVSWSIYFKVWTYDNAMMPACLGLALLAGLAYGRLFSLEQDTTLLLLHAPGIFFSGIALCLLQLGLLFYNPLQQLPSPENRDKAGEFVQFTRQLPGKVWVINHTHFGYLAGKEPYFHGVAFGDIVGGSPPPPGTDAYRRREMAASVFQQAVSEQVFDWIIVDELDSAWEPYYIEVDQLPFEFYPVTGAPIRPKTLLGRNPDANSSPPSSGAP